MTVSTQNAAEERTVLSGVSWETYEALLHNYENSSAPRIAYNQGTIEITSPLPRHEKYRSFVDLVVNVFSYHQGLTVNSFGSTTFLRKDLGKGIEPDNCFYIQNASRVVGKERIDLDVDPPPDLVVEIEIIHSALEKLPVYAAIGASEVWRYRGDRVEMLLLGENGYAEVERSRVLPAFTSESLTALLREVPNQDTATWMRRAMEWVAMLPSTNQDSG